MTESDVQKAVDYLRETAHKAAQARAEQEYTEAWIKVVLAEEMARYASMSRVEADMHAKTSPNYKAALMAHRDAVKAFNEYLFGREAASAVINAWQTKSANERAVRV